jgi:hypothetical protein
MDTGVPPKSPQWVCQFAASNRRRNGARADNSPASPLPSLRSWAELRERVVVRKIRWYAPNNGIKLRVAP